MTARYRCPWCGSAFILAGAARPHIIGTHRTALIRGLGLIEAFDTPDREIAP